MSPDEEELGDDAALWVSPPVHAWWTHTLLDLVFMGQLCFQSGAGRKPVIACVFPLGGWVLRIRCFHEWEESR